MLMRAQQLRWSRMLSTKIATSQRMIVSGWFQLLVSGGSGEAGKEGGDGTLEAG